MKLEELKRLNGIKKVVDSDADIAEMLGNPGSLAELDAALQENAEIAEIISEIMGSTAGASATKKPAAKKPVAQQATGTAPAIKGKPGYKVCPAGLHLIGVRAESCKECAGGATAASVAAPVETETVSTPVASVPEPYPEPTKALTQATQKHYDKLLAYHVAVGQPLTRVQLVAELAVWLAQTMEANINNK